MLVHSVAYFMQMMWYLFVLACVNCKKMVALCINEFISIDMLVNAKKCHVIRFRCLYLNPCVQVSVQNNLVDYAAACLQVVFCRYPLHEDQDER